MQPSPVRVIEIITVIGGDKIDLGSVWQIDRLVKDETTVEHPGMEWKSHLRPTVAHPEHTAGYGSAIG